jgi:hypothetical protein
MQDRLMDELRETLIPDAKQTVARADANRAERRRREREERRLRDALARVEAEQARRRAAR